VTRERISAGCAAIGVMLLVAAGILPADAYPALPLLVGLALLAVSHVLTPCRDQITKWWRHRVLRLK
jgi:hypothetical protein